MDAVTPPATPSVPPVPGRGDRSGDEPEAPGAVVGRAREVDILRRTLDPLLALPGRVDDLARLLGDLTTAVAALTARRSAAPCPSWLLAPEDPDRPRPRSRARLQGDTPHRHNATAELADCAPPAHSTRRTRDAEAPGPVCTACPASPPTGGTAPSKRPAPSRRWPRRSCRVGAGGVLSQCPVSALAQQIHGSVVVRALDAALPPHPDIGGRIAALLDDEGFPQVFAGLLGAILPARGRRTRLQPQPQRRVPGALAARGAGPGRGAPGGLSPAMPVWLFSCGPLGDASVPVDELAGGHGARRRHRCPRAPVVRRAAGSPGAAVGGAGRGPRPCTHSRGTSATTTRSGGGRRG